MYSDFDICDKIINLSYDVEKIVNSEFKKIDDIAMFNSMKVLNAFHKNRVSEAHFNSTSISFIIIFDSCNTLKIASCISLF